MPRRYPSLRTFRTAFISPELGTVSDDDECCICLDRYNDDSHQAVGVTSNSDCGHFFGRQCLEAYLDSTNPGKNTCPICRRKWYTQRPTNPSTPRDTSTVHMLALPGLSRTPLRPSAQSRAPRQRASQEYAQTMDNSTMSQHVELLSRHLDVIEAVEATTTTSYRETRIRLRQVQSRIRAFLERTDETSQISANTAIHDQQPRGVPYSTVERTSRYLPGHGQDPYSLREAASRDSTLPFPDIPQPLSRTLQRPNLSSASALPTSNTGVQSPAPARTRIVGGLPSSLRRGVSMPHPRSEARLRQTQEDNTVTPHSSIDVPPNQAINAQSIEQHLQTYWNEASESGRPPPSGPTHNLRYQQTPIAQLEDTPLPLSFARSAASQAVYRHNNNRHLVHRSGHTTYQSQTQSRSSQTPVIRMPDSTMGSAYCSQPVGTPPQTVLPASMAEPAAGLTSRAVQGFPQGRLSRMTSIFSLQDLSIHNRTIQMESIQSSLRPQRSWLRDILP